MSLGRYEMIFILAPNAPDEEMEQLVSRLESVITGSGGVLLRVEKWGRKRLAYEVKKFREGYYVFFLADCQGSATREVERRLRMTDRVIKFLTVRIDEELQRVGKLHPDELGRPRETERIDRGKKPGIKPPARPAIPGQEPEEDEGGGEEGPGVISGEAAEEAAEERGEERPRERGGEEEGE